MFSPSCKGQYFALVALYLLSTELPLLARQVLLISLLTDVPW
jgi:magnesium-transporting ATPase (P-type)